MAIIEGQTSPTFQTHVRKLAQDDGGEVILDKVDAVSAELLNNTIAAWNRAGQSSQGGIKTVSLLTYDITTDDGTILCDGSVNTVDANLPTAVGNEGQTFNVKAIDITNAVTLNAQGGESIDGQASFSFASQYDGVTVQSDGSNWWIL